MRLAFIADQQVWLINNGSAHGKIDGVEHLNLAKVSTGQIGGLSLDACIVVNDSRLGGMVRDLLGKDVPIVLWVHANTDARSAAPLAESAVAAQFDAFAFVSATSRNSAWRWKKPAYCAMRSRPHSRIAGRMAAASLRRCAIRR